MKTLLERIVVNFLAKSKEPSVAPKKTLLEQITEEFLSEEESGATQQAKEKGLKWMGFDRWADNSGEIKFKANADKTGLEPWTKEDEEDFITGRGLHYDTTSQRAQPEEHRRSETADPGGGEATRDARCDHFTDTNLGRALGARAYRMGSDRR